MTQAEPGPQTAQDGAPSPSEAIIGDTAPACKTEHSKSADALLTSASGLNELHRRELASSGISDETIATSGIHSHCSVGRTDKALRQRLVIPYLDPSGSPYEITGGKPFLRWKPVWSNAVRQEYAAQLKEPPKYLSHRNAGNRPYHSPANAADNTYRIKLKRGGSKFPLIFTEGEKKTLKANQDGFLTIGLVGVYGWTDSRCTVDDDGDKTLLPELQAEVEFNNRTIYIAFDSDLDKPEVRGAIDGFAIACDKLGASCKLVRLPVELDRAKNGMDDFLQRHGANALQLLIENAQPLVVTKQAAKKEHKDDPQTYIYSVKTWHAEPKGKIASHLKAVVSYSVLKEDWAHRQSAGLYRWVDTHWQRQKERAEKAIRLPLQQFSDAQQWLERESGQANSIISLLVDRLTKADGYEWAPGHLLSFQNGTLDTTTGELTIGHRRSDLLTTSLPFDYDPEAQCPQWHAFLKSAFGGDQGLINLMQAIIKWIVLPKDRTAPFKVQKAFNFHGLRGSGKGTAAETIAALVGEEFVGGGKPEVFGKEEALSKLVDKKLALDMDADGFLPSSSTFNKVVSNERVDFRYLFRDGGYERLGVVILWCSNDPIAISKNGAEGVGRRLVTIPFNHPPTCPDMDLAEKLRSELAGIFQWAWSLTDDEMYARLTSALDNEQVRDATTDHQLASNRPLQWWLETFHDKGTQGTFIEANSGGWVSAQVLMASYAAWLEACHFKDQGRDSLTSLLSKLASQGLCEKKKSNGRMVYRFDATADFDLQAYLGMKSLGSVPETAPASPASLKAPCPKSTGMTDLSTTQGVKGVKIDIKEAIDTGVPLVGGTPPFLEKDMEGDSLPPLTPWRVPEPLVNTECSTVATWVSAAIDGLGDINAAVDEDTVYSVIKSWTRAPAISRAQVRSALERIKPTQQDCFDF